MSLFAREAMGHTIPYYLFSAGSAEEDNDEWRRTDGETQDKIKHKKLIKGFSTLSEWCVV